MLSVVLSIDVFGGHFYLAPAESLRLTCAFSVCRCSVVFVISDFNIHSLFFFFFFSIPQFQFVFFRENPNFSILLNVILLMLLQHIYMYVLILSYFSHYKSLYTSH